MENRKEGDLGAAPNLELILEALYTGHQHTCSFTCPSVKKEGEEWKHSEECRELTEAIRLVGAALSSPLSVGAATKKEDKDLDGSPRGLPDAARQEIQGAKDLAFELGADICSDHCDLDPLDHEKMDHCTWCGQATRIYQILRDTLKTAEERNP